MEVVSNVSPMRWIPSLYFAKGMPYVIVMVISLVLFRQKGMDPATITMLVASFYLPWVLKPWWKPRFFRSLDCRSWLLLTEFLLAVAFLALAFSLGSILLTFLLFWVIAMLNSVHNAAVDSYYRQVLSDEERSVYRHVREFSRKCSIVVGQGIIVMLAGNLQVFYRNNISYSWSLMFYCVSGLFFLFCFWHLYAVPRQRHVRKFAPASAGPLSRSVALFLLGYGLSYAFLSKVSVLFLLDTSRRGGLGLSPQEFGLVMGGVGIVALTVGSTWGHHVLHRHSWGVMRWLMASAMLVPGVCYLLMSLSRPSTLFAIGTMVGLEQLCYGFGFSFYLRLLHLLPGGEWKKSLMALMFLIPVFFSGWLQVQLGYPLFFGCACLLGASAFLAVSNREIPNTE